MTTPFEAGEDSEFDLQVKNFVQKKDVSYSFCFVCCFLERKRERFFFFIFLVFSLFKMKSRCSNV